APALGREENLPGEPPDERVSARPAVRSADDRRRLESLRERLAEVVGRAGLLALGVRDAEVVLLLGAPGADDDPGAEAAGRWTEQEHDAIRPRSGSLCGVVAEERDRVAAVQRERQPQ